jgi:hypothetical protein
MRIVNPIDIGMRCVIPLGMSKVRVFSFDERGGRRPDPERPGKSTWPHCLHVHLNKYRAGELAESLVRFINTAKEGDHYTFSSMGKLLEVDEDTDETSEELEGLRGD